MAAERRDSTPHPGRRPYARRRRAERLFLRRKEDWRSGHWRAARALGRIAITRHAPFREARDNASPATTAPIRTIASATWRTWSTWRASTSAWNSRWCATPAPGRALAPGVRCAGTVLGQPARRSGRATAASANGRAGAGS